ncbi:hypothetical protein OC834_001638 [Tilletia horrida]|nr:hypothetical protein OC834_001638 [Tilletia horrida]
MYHPTRGGTRGGQAEFSWEQVRNDKDREHYLGHAIMAPTGRWQNGRDVNWYNKDKQDAAKEKEARLEELRKIKEAEEQALASVLGYVPKSSSGAVVGSALASGSSSRTPGAYSSTGSNMQPLDPSRSRWPGAGPSSKEPPRSGKSREDDDDADGEGDDGSGLTREERKAARKLAKLEVRNQLKSDKELRRAEREERRARKKEREERRGGAGRSREGDDEDEGRSRSGRHESDRDGDRNSRYRDDDERHHSHRSTSSRHNRESDRRRDSRSPIPRRHRSDSRSRSPLPRRDPKDRHEDPERRRLEHHGGASSSRRREDDYYGRISSSRRDRSPTPPYQRY